MKKLFLILGFVLAINPLFGMNQRDQLTIDPKKVYDQSSLIKNYPNFKQDLDKIKQGEKPSADYQAFQKQCEGLCKVKLNNDIWLNSLRKCVPSLIPLVTTFAISWAMAQYSDKTTADVLSSGYTIMPLIWCSNDVIKHLCFAIRDRFFKKNFDQVLGEQEKRYVRNKQLFPEPLQRSIEEQFKYARLGDEQLVKSAHFINKALALPLIQRKVFFKSSALKHFEDTTLYIHNDNPNLINGIKNLLWTCIQPQASKRVICFFGPSGTGKSYLASKIAEFANLAVGNINLSTTSIGALEGIALPSPQATPGIIAQGLLACGDENNSINKVLCLDEIEKELATQPIFTKFIHKLLEDGHNTFHDKYFNADLDVSNLVIILCINKEFSSKSLMNRVKGGKFIEFKPISKANKKAVMKKMFNTVKNSSFWQDNITEIDRLIKDDENDGLRIIQGKIQDLYETKSRVRWEESASITSSFELVLNGCSKSPIPLKTKKTQ